MEFSAHKSTETNPSIISISIRMDTDNLIRHAIRDDNDPPAVRRYLGADGDPNGKARGGCPALVAAAVCGRTDITKMLVEADASLELRNSDEWTALIAAAIGGAPRDRPVPPARRLRPTGDVQRGQERQAVG
eukprot:COSAG02_NODE_418_length_22698_cov_7.471127_9_plen_132_part_00